MNNEKRLIRCGICNKRKHELVDTMPTYYLYQCVNCNAMIMIEKKKRSAKK
jgi:predicted transcriptional regulator